MNKRRYQTFILFFLFFSSIVFSQKPPSTLPVEIIYFTGQYEDNSILLLWGTATEHSNAGFEIERRDTLNPWAPLDVFIVGAGDSASPKDYSYRDTSLIGMDFYYYRLKQIDNTGGWEYHDSIRVSLVTGVDDESPVIPGEVRLFQNYPNPFNPTTVISYQLTVGSDVRLKIFDALGNEIAFLVDEYQNAGIHYCTFDVMNHSLSSGIYFYTLSVGTFSETRKLLLIK
ncbi:MAG: T9SS type A sorting domain-containing protein [bacterium]